MTPGVATDRMRQRAGSVFRGVSMIMRVAASLMLTCVLLQVSPVHARDAIVLQRATLRNDPSTQHAPILILAPTEDIELLGSEETGGYYHVRTSEGDEGWVWAGSLEVVPDHPARAAPVLKAMPPSSHLLAKKPGTPGGVASSISPSWDKPDPNKTSFDGVDGHCGPTGDGGDALTNARKNRTDDPAEYHSVTWKAVDVLPYPDAPKTLEKWTSAQLAEIEPYEGVAVSVVGYLAAIKVEGAESTNCHFTAATEVDWHMPLVQSEGDDESTSIVVETTPRMRKLHAKWTKAALSPWVDSAEPVRISGWALLDPEHRAHLGKFRDTLWEIHPITKIEVFQDGRWVNLDDLP
jgi:hypothetical protein